LLLAQGSDGIDELTKRAEELGLVLDNRAAAAVDRNSKALERFLKIITTFSAKTTGGILASTLGTGDDLLDAKGKLEDLIRQRDRFIGNQPENFQTFIPGAVAQINLLNDQIRELAAQIFFLENKKKAAEPSPFEISPAGLADLRLPSDPRFDSDEDLARAAEKAAEEMRRQDEKLRDDMIDQRQDFNKLFLDEQERVAKQVSDNLEDEVRRRNEIEQNARDQNVQREIAFQDQILAIRKQGVAAAQILLTAYGGRFAALGKAILLVEKVNAIKSTFISTREAVMKTFAKYGATPIGYAAAAAVAVLGAAQIAAIAAQGSSGSSGGSIGGAPRGDGQPGFDPVTNPSQPFVNNAPQTATQIIIQGAVFSSRETADFIIQQIREAVDKRDVVIIGSGSRQAQEIMNR
jgi:hypothetical protein